MLSIAKLSRGREEYYLSTLAAGRRESGGLIEPDGQWLGRAAGSLRLEGTVEANALRAVFAGVDPVSGEILSSHHARVRVAAFDCTFSTPKSVSVLGALGREEVKTEVFAGHLRATEAAFGYLEQNGARVRRGLGSGEVVSLPAEGFVAASFLHRTSRAPDPHLHSHVLVANVSRGPEGRWSALDGRSLYLGLRTARDLYETQLRSELTTRLGVSWRDLQGTWADIAGVDPKLTRAFSRRSAEIKAALERSGRSGPRAERLASLNTRKKKDLDTPYEALVETWRERSYRLGISDARLASLANRPQTVRAPAGDWAEKALGEDGLLARSGACGRSELISWRCASLPAGAEVAAVQAEVDALVAEGRLVPVPHQARAPGHALKGPSPRQIPSGVTETMYTTPEILELHQRLVTLVRGHPGSVELLAYKPGARLEALDALGSLVLDEKRPLRAVAPGIVAAASLEATTGLEAISISQAAKGSPPHDGSGGSVVVAEAHRFGPWEMASLLEPALESGDKIILFAPSVSLEARFATAGVLAPELEAFSPPVHRNPFGSQERESHLFGGREVVVAQSGAQARETLLEIWARERALGGRALIVASDDSVVARLREAVVDAGGLPGEVVEARGFSAAIAREKDAPVAVTKIAALGTTPELGRARTDLIVRVGVADGNLAPPDRVGRAAELARPQYLVSELGPVPALPTARATWRKGAVAIEAFRKRWSIGDEEHAFGDKKTLRDRNVVAFGEAVEASVKARQVRGSIEKQQPGRARSRAERAMSR